VIAARGSVFQSLDRGQTWNELGRGLPSDRYVLSAVNGGVVADGTGGVFACSALVRRPRVRQAGDIRRTSPG
jgi:hypothetical protein